MRKEEKHHSEKMADLTGEEAFIDRTQVTFGGVPEEKE